MAKGQAAAPAAVSAPSSGAETTHAVPRACSDPTNCYPPAAFVDAVCRHRFPNLPLHLFAGRTPWRRLYVKAESVEPVNPHGGDQSEAWMQFGEEVLVLRKRGPSSVQGVQVSGPTDLDVLRWDGTCATIREELLVSYVPGPMQSPLIIWKYLDTEAQEILLAKAVVARARQNEKKACRDSSLTHPTPNCWKAMRQLTDAVVLVVHQGLELPGSDALPQWAPELQGNSAAR